MSFRKERKFRLSHYDAQALKSELFGRGMKPLYPDRLITSQYFDARDDKAFHDSEEGSLPRKKIRTRWYNQDRSKLAWEEKVSSIEGRFKTSRPIRLDDFARICREGYMDNLYGHVMPSVVISYRRAYFMLDGHRITFDSEIFYQDSRSLREVKDFEEVVEIKVPYETDDDLLADLIPTPASRFSKYARAYLSFDLSV